MRKRMTRGPPCGVSFDEIPFADCETHRRHIAAEPELTDEEFEVYLDDLAAEILHGQD